MIREQIVEDLCAELEKFNIKSVSDHSGVSVTTLYCWLDGRTKAPRIDNIAKVARAIGMELTLNSSEKLKLAA